jgi:predicted nucleic acid-binding protein
VILADTSAWVEFDRATGSRVDLRLTELISRGRGLAVTEPVIAEVAAGARTGEQENALRRMLARSVLLPFDSAVDFDSAVIIYRRCRQAGVTPRGLFDCMITAVALRHGASILAHDADMAHIAEVVPVKLDQATMRPLRPHEP